MIKAQPAGHTTHTRAQPATQGAAVRPAGLPIRLRLALWCGTLLAVGLLCCSTLVYLVSDHALRAAGDDRLAGRARRIDALLQVAARAAHQMNLPSNLSIFSPSTIGYVLFDAHGQILQQTPGLDPIVGDQARLQLTNGWHFYDQTLAGEPFRALLQARTGAEPVRYIAVIHSVQETTSTMGTLREVLIGGDVLCLLGVAVAAWLLAGRALAPIDSITRTAAAIAESHDTARRVPAVPRADEVGRLAATVNGMLANLDASQEVLRRFVADASHELRTPITSIRGNADVLLRDPHLPLTERRATLQDIADEAAWLSQLVEGLLALALGDAGLAFQPQPVDLHDLVRATCASWATRPGPMLTLVDCAQSTVHANPGRLGQLLIILLDNATKFTPAEGFVLCSLQVQDSHAELIVRDTGIGIHPRDLPHIFARFFRPAQARGARSGAGLGLAIATQIVDEVGGTIEVESEPGRGTAFIVRLPLIAAAERRQER